MYFQEAERIEREMARLERFAKQSRRPLPEVPVLSYSPKRLASGCILYQLRSDKRPAWRGRSQRGDSIDCK
jgi:hypothetical protein